MPDNFDLILTGGQVATPNGLESCDIGVRGGRIAAVGALGSAAAADRFNAAGLTVLPGVIDTQMTDALPMDEVMKIIPMRRVGKPEDVAAAVSYLCSDGAAYVTRQVLSVNGGMA